MASVSSYARLQSPGWSRARVQLGGGLLLAALLPFSLAALVNPHIQSLDLFGYSLVACIVAILSGFYFFNSLVSYPGITASYYIFPVFSSVYASVAAGLLMLRLDYTRALLIGSYLICVVWYYIVHFMIRKSERIRIAIAPFGEIDGLRTIPNISWEIMQAPRLPRERDTIVVADFRAEMPEAWQRFLADAALEGVQVLHVKQLRESLTGCVEIEHLSESANGTLTPQAAYRSVKSAVDMVVAALMLVPLAPLFAVIALLIRLDSPGPAFFRQRRVGYRGVPFRVWKFRTMAHRDACDGPEECARSGAITCHADPRITAIGRLLRRTRLDELPQIINVLFGEMSFIGPRPEAEVLSQWYETEIPFYRYRHIVYPGITGWAQVNQGHVADVQGVHRKLHFDFFYISNFSPWLDLLIVIRTVRTMMTGFGSK